MDCRQRHIPEEELDKISPFQKKAAQLLNVFSSSGEQAIRELPVAQDVKLLQVGQGGKGRQLSITRLCKMFWVLLVTVLQ